MPLYPTYSDEQLIELLRLGDQVAFTEIFNRYWGDLLDIAYQRLKSREASEEVVQEIFLNLYVRSERVAPKSTLRAYLKSALKYKVIDAYRAQQMYYKHLDRMVEEIQVDVIRPNQVLEMKEFRRRVRRIAEKLPEKCREAFVLSRFDELSHQEIASRMGISVVTVKSHLNKALKIVREELGGNRVEFLAVCFFMFSG